MIKNVFIFTLLQIYVMGKNMIQKRGGINMIFILIYRPLYFDYNLLKSYRYHKNK